MQVRVKLFASLKQYVPGLTAGVPIEVELPAGATLTDLVRQMKLPQAEINLIYVNARAQPLTYILNPADEVGIFPKIGGG